MLVGRLALVGALTVALTCVSVGTAAAHLSGPTNSTACTDFNRIEPEAAVTFWYLDLNTTTITDVNWARTNSVDPTDVNTSGASSQSTADVVVEDSNYSTFCGFTWHSSTADGVVGLAKCNALWSGPFTGYCDRFGVYIDTSFTGATTQANRRALAAHEIGHTLGAYHESGTTVMVQGYPKPTTAFGTHVTTEINNVF